MKKYSRRFHVQCACAQLRLSKLNKTDMYSQGKRKWERSLCIFSFRKYVMKGTYLTVSSLGNQIFK